MRVRGRKREDKRRGGRKAASPRGNVRRESAFGGKEESKYGKVRLR